MTPKFLSYMPIRLSHLDVFKGTVTFPITLCFPPLPAAFEFISYAFWPVCVINSLARFRDAALPLTSRRAAEPPRCS